MGNRKLVVSDYDGTFYLNDDDIARNVDKVNEFREQSNLFIIATGNNFRRFQEVILQYGINYDYLILDQGACIFDNQGRLLKACFIDYDTSKRIMDEVKGTNNKHKICNPLDDSGCLEDRNTTKIGVDFTDLQEAYDFTEKINREFGDRVRAYTMIFDGVYIVEIISKETDKNEAIKFVAAKEGIQKSDIYTVGDGYNDISMIQNFNGYCMKNSVDKLRELCPNRVSSVAELIEKVLLEKSKPGTSFAEGPEDR